ncbi:hypothetical protein [Mucilaginibacter sp. CSA2-8R]|uniref:hypothetical protein n=1 Tax=Mucilaginibacter sp. CSA2-8R TaxID=3141542 RepID=UPI00315D25A2
MTAIEIKAEIKKIVDEVPEESLAEILDFLKEVKNQSTGELQQSSNFKAVINKHRGLLKRLAQ